MAEVLDYSSGWPAPATIKAAGYAGVVRYAGTRGRSKNITLAEANALKNARVPVALVYESGAGWMLDGFEAGVGAARALLADAADLAVGVRAAYMACDVDVTSEAQMLAVERCLDGAAQVLGLARVGVYGEADVIDRMLGRGRATWGWQTRAWSGGRTSARAHIRQELGYVYPDGVQCDRSTVLADDGDWGGWTVGGLMADLTAQNLTDIANRVVEVMKNDRLGVLLAIRNELVTVLADPTHKYLQDEFKASDDSVFGKLDALGATLAAQVQASAAAIAAEVVAALPPAATGQVDYDEVETRAVAAIRAVLRDGVGAQ